MAFSLTASGAHVCHGTVTILSLLRRRRIDRHERARRCAPEASPTPALARSAAAPGSRRDDRSPRRRPASTRTPLSARRSGSRSAATPARARPTPASTRAPRRTTSAPAQARGDATRAAPRAASPPPGAPASHERSRSRPRSCPGAGRCPHPRAAAPRRARRTGPPAPGRSRRKPRERPRACAGSSATRAPTGIPRGRGARRSLARRAPAAPIPRRGSPRTPGPSCPSSARPRRSHVDLYPAGLDPHRKRLHRQHGRERQRAPGADLDVRAVARADRIALLGIEVPLAERPVVVRAPVLERAVPAAEVVDADRDLTRVDDLHRPRRQVLDRADVDLRQRAGLLQLELVEARPLLGQRRSLRAVQRDLEHAEAEQRALEPDRGQRDAYLLEQLLLRKLGDLGRPPALDHLHEHRGRGLADRAPPPGELNVVDRVAVLAELHVDRDLV